MKAHSSMPLSVTLKKDFEKNKYKYLLIMPVLVYFILF